jgi:hypothetical protein
MRPEVTDYLHDRGVKYLEGEGPSTFIDETDVIYVTRLQKERFPDPKKAEALRGSYFLTRDLLKRAPKNAIVLHHLPRIEEIPLEIDYTPNARYFQQAANGVPVRMALLYLCVYGSKYRPVKHIEPIPITCGTQRCANSNCISNQPGEPIVPTLEEITSEGERVFQCQYCGRYTKE